VEVWLIPLVSLVLLAVAGGLLASHVRAWRRLPEADYEPRERDFRRTQLRRRMQTSAMMILLAVALFASRFLPRSVLPMLFYWGGVLLLLLWIALLAVVDIWATKHYFGRMRHEYLVERAKLEAELRRLRSTQGNGKAAERRSRSEK
jgi:hypothetical protein